MASNRVMSAPVCLIDTDVNGLLCVRKDAKEILEGITEPVVVVSVVGLYRTGKSYLMNRLAGRQSGFALGNTIESKTKGIWMWCVPHPTQAGHTLVLLDTEGLGDVDKGDEKHDTWIFCLALLLSSTLVYNSLGVIDNMALERLHYVTEMKEHMRMKTKEQNRDESGQYMSFFPAFVWTVRDFYLELEKDNKPITADQYLDGALDLKPGISPRIEQHNLPRRCLRNFFATRKCFVFPRPASPKDMKKMEELTEAELDPEFLQQSKVFCQHIYSSAQSKTIAEGCTVTGRVLANLADVYVLAIRNGSAPCLENAVISLSKIHNTQALEEALQFYVKDMLELIKLPVNSKQLSNLHKTAEQKAIEVFIRMSFNDTNQTYQRQLAMNIQKHYEDLCEQNKEASKNVCLAVLHHVFKPLEDGLRSGYYMKPGGYRQFRDTLTELATTYRSQTQMQIMSEEVLSKCWKEKEESGRTILAADESLTAAEHEIQVQKLKNKALEQQQRSLEEQNLLHIQIMEDQKRTHEEHTKQIMEKMEKEQERMRKDQEQVMEAKLKEQKSMLQSGLQKDVTRLQGEINDIKAKNKDESNCCIL